MNSRTLDRVMHLTWNRAVAADFTFDTPLNRLFEPSQEPNSSTGYPGLMTAWSVKTCPVRASVKRTLTVKGLSSGMSRGLSNTNL